MPVVGFLHRSELPRIGARLFGGKLDAAGAQAALARWLDGAGADHVAELRHEDRLRLFHLGDFTWVEQQGLSLAELDARQSAAPWDELPAVLPAWDAAITAFNDDVRAAARSSCPGSAPSLEPGALTAPAPRAPEAP